VGSGELLALVAGRLSGTVAVPNVASGWKSNPSRSAISYSGWELEVAIARLLRSLLLETLPAIDGFVRSRHEGHFRVAATIRADCRIELARAGRIASASASPAVATAITVSAVVVATTRRVALGLAPGPARRTPHWLGKTPLCVKRLLTSRECKFLSAISTGECFVTHSA
jgi:hypothetical protein